MSQSAGENRGSLVFPKSPLTSSFPVWAWTLEVFEIVIYTLRVHLNSLKGCPQFGSQPLQPQEAHTSSRIFCLVSGRGSPPRLGHRLMWRASKIADALAPTPGDSDSLGWRWKLTQHF